MKPPSIRSALFTSAFAAFVTLACACKTPAILTTDPPGACGQWPVQCALSMGGGCCFEGWACRGQEDCEYMGTDVGGARARTIRPRTH